MRIQPFLCRSVLVPAFAALAALSACAPDTTGDGPGTPIYNASHTCMEKYPLAVGTMTLQSTCLTQALNQFGTAAYGDNLPVVLKINQRRDLYWRQADAETILVFEAIGAYEIDRDSLLRAAAAATAAEQTRDSLNARKGGPTP